MIKLIGFDLDGTIADTIPMCIRAFDEAVRPYTSHELSEEEIVQTFGLNEEGMIRRVVDRKHWQDALADFYRVYKEMHGMCPRPFAGITELIEEVKNRSVPVALITGKGAASCAITLEQFGMENCFDRIATGDAERNVKSEAIRVLLSEYRLQADEMVYVGDALSDISACREAGVSCLSAAWAVSAEVACKLEKHNPDRVFQTVQALRGFLMENKYEHNKKSINL